MRKMFERQGSLFTKTIYRIRTMFDRIILTGLSHRYRIRRLWIEGCTLRVHVAFETDPVFRQLEAELWINRVRDLYQDMHFRSRLSDDGVEEFRAISTNEFLSWPLRMNALRHIVDEHHADLRDLKRRGRFFLL